MPTTRGLVALGDSITNGRGEPALGVHAQSWAQWLPEALELPFTKLAGHGAPAAHAPRARGPPARADRRRPARAGPTAARALRRRLRVHRRQRRPGARLRRRRLRARPAGDRG